MPLLSGAAAGFAARSRPRAFSAAARYAAWGLVGGALLYYLTYFNYGIDLDDEGYLLLNAASILHGQWPMADFFSYAPLSYFLLALFFKLFGNGVLIERVMLMGVIVLNVALVHTCTKRLLPPSWAWLPAAVYAFAPGPWYKVFFISHLLISLAALLSVVERPGVGRALLLGLTAGLAVVSRVEAGAVIVVLVVGFLAVYAWRGDVAALGTRLASGPARLRALVALEAAFVVGLLVPVAVFLAAYGLAGKIPALLHNVAHYYNEPRYIGYVNAIPGVATVFSVRRLFMGGPLEMWVYAVAMVVCVVNGGRYAWEILTTKASRPAAFIGFAIAIFGIGSLGYTYFYVWNSRMLSSFAIVYVNYAGLLFAARQALGARGPAAWAGRAAAALGIVAILIYLKSFIVVQNYSGSYTANVPASMAAIDAPVLKGIHVYNDQVDDIAGMLQRTARAPQGSTLVSMSEATTMGYIAGLPNPTYYRLFVTEFAPAGERERALQTFERYRIRYFVARRSQFLPGGGEGSNLDAYAPQIKAYLVAKYRITPLGRHFVLLERRPGL